MFRRISNGQNQKRNRKPEIREKPKPEEFGIGNEALAEMIGNAVTNNISNEANNALGANVNPDGNSQDGLDQYDRNDFNNIRSAKKKKDGHNNLLDLDELSQSSDGGHIENLSQIEDDEIDIENISQIEDRSRCAAVQSTNGKHHGQTGPQG